LSTMLTDVLNDTDKNEHEDVYYCPKVQQGFLLVPSPGKPCSGMSGLANVLLGMCDKYACKHCSDWTCLTVSSHIFIVYNLLLLIEARRTCIF